MSIKFYGSDTEIRKFKQQCFENYDHCEKAWFNRFVRFRERYFKDGRTPTDDQQEYLDRLLEKVDFFNKLKNEIVFD